MQPSVTASHNVDDATIIRMLHMEMIRELGKGSFGTVYEVKNLADRLKVALKIVKDPRNAVQAIREGQRLRRAKRKNIVLMHKVHDIGDGCCALEMEVMPGGDLFQHLVACRRLPNARLPHDAVLRFSRQLLEALIYLHDELKWLHGDIKPQNILMQCNTCTLGRTATTRRWGGASRGYSSFSNLCRVFVGSVGKCCCSPPSHHQKHIQG
jgi:serine/threonine protein kinase